MLRLNLTILLVLMISYSAFAQKQLWQKQMAEIKLMVTTENEIEKMFGKPVEQNPEGRTYKTNYGYIDVFYSVGICTETRFLKYKVGKGVVLAFHFRALKKIKFAQFGIDVSGWETRVDDLFLPPTVIYSNLDKNITLWVRKGILYVVHVYPSKAVDYLECSK